ncbi:G protein-coupled receptor rhodopsin-like, partial [Trinorchestia longiramus]
GATVFVSAYSLVAISIDRYLAIIYPLRPRMTRLQARVIIWLVWVLALITTAPLAVFSKLFEPNSNYYKVYHLKVCMEDWGDATEEQAAYSAALMFLQYVLPVTVLVFTYTRIGLVVWGKKALGETPARHDRIARGKRK